MAGLGHPRCHRGHLRSVGWCGLTRSHRCRQQCGRRGQWRGDPRECGHAGVERHAAALLPPVRHRSARRPQGGNPATHRRQPDPAQGARAASGRTALSCERGRGACRVAFHSAVPDRRQVRRGENAERAGRHQQVRKRVLPRDPGRPPQRPAAAGHRRFVLPHARGTAAPLEPRERGTRGAVRATARRQVHGYGAHRRGGHQGLLRQERRPVHVDRVRRPGICRASPGTISLAGGTHGRGPAKAL